MIQSDRGFVIRPGSHEWLRAIGHQLDEADEIEREREWRRARALEAAAGNERSARMLREDEALPFTVPPDYD